MAAKRGPVAWALLAVAIVVSASGCVRTNDSRSEALQGAAKTAPTPSPSDGWVEGDSHLDGCLKESSGDEIPPFYRQRATGAFDAATFVRTVESSVEDVETFDAPAGAEGRMWTVPSKEGSITVELLITDGKAQLTTMGPDRWC